MKGDLHFGRAVLEKEEKRGKRGKKPRPHLVFCNMSEIEYQIKGITQFSRSSLNILSWFTILSSPITPFIPLGFHSNRTYEKCILSVDSLVWPAKMICSLVGNDVI